VSEKGKLKAFTACALDGKYDYLVAATSLVKAAKLMGTSSRTLRNYGLSEETEGDDYNTAMAEPGLVWRRLSGVTQLLGKQVYTWEPKGRRKPKPPVRVKWIVAMSTQSRHEDVWEIDWYEWHGMSGKEREETLDEMMQAEISNHVDAGWAVQDDSEYWRDYESPCFQEGEPYCP
jgi:hypothetical protein